MFRRFTGRLHRARAASFVLAFSVLAIACGGGNDGGRNDDEALPTQPLPATLELLPTATPRATNTPTPGAAADDGTGAPGGPATLPGDPEAVVVQLARIEHSAWEPAIKGQMAPHFSLQASGFGVFQSPIGDSLDGWYQTAIAPHEAEAFLRVLMDDIGVLDLAASRPERPLRFTFGDDGEPAECEAYGVIFVRSAQRSGRLVISECELESPTGADAEALGKLNEVVNILESWKSIADHSAFGPPPTDDGSRRPAADVSAEPVQDLPDAFRALLGFYSPIRQPYTPDSAVAFGTRARASIPGSALKATWPITPLLATAFDADYGTSPSELRLAPPDSTAVLREELLFHRARPASFWGPLWEDPAGFPEADATLFSVGVRPSVPGSNEVVLDYEYVVPRRGIGVGR